MHLKGIAQVLEVCIVPSNIETLPQVLSMKKLREGLQASAFITMISTLQKEYLWFIWNGDSTKYTYSMCFW